MKKLILGFIGIGVIFFGFWHFIPLGPSESVSCTVKKIEFLVQETEEGNLETAYLLVYLKENIRGNEKEFFLQKNKILGRDTILYKSEKGDRILISRELWETTKR